MDREYALGMLPFTRDPHGVKKSYLCMPSFLHLFGLFWTRNKLQSICIETNCYARVVEDGRSKGGHDWYDMDKKELRAFMAVSLYMGMKKQLNVKSYWAKSKKLFYCLVIANLLSQRCFLALQKYLHLTNTSDSCIDTTSLQCDKMDQCRWPINSIQDACRKVWNVAKICTVDEMMVRYKEKYCPTCQYMPKKPIKWGVKLWCLACATSKFIYNFDIYCGKTMSSMDGEDEAVPSTEGNLAEGVVLKMILDKKGHVVVMDNYFTSIGLFEKLLEKGIYAIGTV